MAGENTDQGRLYTPPRLIPELVGLIDNGYINGTYQPVMHMEVKKS
jgi:hypothetical protein